MAKAKKKEEATEEAPKAKKGPAAKAPKAPKAPKAKKEPPPPEDDEEDEGDEGDEGDGDQEGDQGEGDQEGDGDQEAAATIEEPLQATGRPVSMMVQRQRLASAPASERKPFLESLPAAARAMLLEVPHDEIDGLLAIRTKAELEEAGFTFPAPRIVDTRGAKQLPLAAHRMVELKECRFIYTDVQEGIRVTLTSQEKHQLLERAAASGATIVKLRGRVAEMKAALKDMERDIQAQERERDRCIGTYNEGHEVRDCRTRYYLTPQRMVLEAIEVRDGEIEISRPRFPRAEEDGKIERCARGPLFGEGVSLAERGEQEEPPAAQEEPATTTEQAQAQVLELAPLRARIMGFHDAGPLDLVVIQEDEQEAKARGVPATLHAVPVKAGADVDRSVAAQVLVGFVGGDHRHPIVLGRPLTASVPPAAEEDDPGPIG